MPVYYVVYRGRKPGIYKNWQECQKQVEKFEGAIFKKFNNETDAKQFLDIGFGNNKKPRSLVIKENADKKNAQLIANEEIDEENKIFIYTDGSCIKMKNGISKAGFGIYIPDKNIRVSKPLLNQKITNNRAEMTAIIDSIQYLDEEDLTKKIVILTDSQYSMYIFNGTGERYEKDNFKNNGVDVPNIDLIKKLLEIKRTYDVVLLKIRAHTDKSDKHSIGNSIADKLANDGALDNNDIHSVFKCEYEIPIISKKFDIKMNELFEGDILEDFNETETETEIIKPKIIKNNKSKLFVNKKLSNWFVVK